MQKKYDASWKFRHSLHLIVIFIPIIGFAGFFRRKACSGQKRWSIIAWIYLALTVVAFIVSNNKASSNGYMTFYAIFYLAAFVYACATLPSYLRTVIKREQDVQAEQTPDIATGASADDSSAGARVVFTPADDAQDHAPVLSADAAIREIHRLNELLKDQPIYPQLCEIETVSAQILEYVSKNPEEQNAAHTYTSYYLPEYLKLLKNYIELSQAQVKTDKLLKTMAEIQESLPKTLASFKNLYNSLYSEKAEDISNSINVMERMMSQDGLTDNTGTDSDDSIHLKL